MRGFVPRGRVDISVQLMIMLTAVYAVQMINQVYLRWPLEPWFGLSVQGLAQGKIWQLFTFQFLHGGLWHLIGNLIVLYFFGRWVEQVLGRQRFLAVYLAGGLLGGIVQAALMAGFPRHFGGLLYGASAGAHALIAVFAWLEAESEILLSFIIPIKAKVLLWILAGVSLFFTLVPADQSVAHAAHLGGILSGIGFVKLGWHHDYVKLPWEHLLERFRSRRVFRSKLAASTGTKAGRWDLKRGAKSSSPKDDLDFISREVDPILDKISAHGMHSLTEQERKILDAARGRMSRR